MTVIALTSPRADTRAMRELQIVDAAELATAYAAAEYVVVLDGDTLPLRVGQPASDLQAYSPAPHYAFITAWNPASEPRSDGANQAADGSTDPDAGERTHDRTRRDERSDARNRQGADTGQQS